MTTVRAVSAAEPGLVDALAALLVDAVDGGASVGYLAPLAPERARHYWSDVLSALGPELRLWVAEVDGTVAGSVQLAPSGRENGRHRAEIQRLLVHRAHRGKGIARALMAAAEDEARRLGRTMLVLDTQRGSAAEAIYGHLGWQRAGEIPDYAATPDGSLQPTVYFYKQLVTTG
ncbi:MAG: GNAT family N-acetyltransferase [Ectothiorhodospiraceae bacterium]|nr:GNAT family N-acetyltransferase [Chromatiales bacterium]MCP5156516.1 GNAT family N-acetyltransferase [Ectothiorhodospiraceae bacterium]